MNIFIAGATGTLGRAVVPLLKDHGHRVVGLTRTEAGRRKLDAMGVEGVIGNALDGPMLQAQVAAAAPEIVLHLLTALPADGSAMRPRQLEPTNELRRKGTANLLEASIAAGARRLVAESFATVYGIDQPPRPLTENQALEPITHGSLRETILALRALENELAAAAAAGNIETVALRIGYLYGADVPSTRALVAQARAGRLFAPRGLTGMAPFVHISDAASAILAAVEAPAVSPVYNVAGEPATIEAFISELTRDLKLPAARHVPHWLGRLISPVIVEMGTAELMLSTARIQQELGWVPRYPTIEAGMRELGAARDLAA
jgi:nucleoside-diphosphate-sugar epimerase